MKLQIHSKILQKIHQHGQAAYPHEGAGFLLGQPGATSRVIVDILPVENEREAEARHNRYLIGPREMLRGEDAAEERGLEIVGIFHSHPDHPDQPSVFDRDWALPWYSYIITSVVQGMAASSRSWRLAQDRSGFDEEHIEALDTKGEQAA